jgi:hypothetical protein
MLPLATIFLLIINEGYGMAASGSEVKSTPGLEVGTQDDLLIRVMSDFPDGTIGVFEIKHKKSFFGSGYYAGELKILQSNPLKVLKTYTVDLSKEGYQDLLHILRQMPWVSQPVVKLVMVNNTYVIILNEANRLKRFFVLDIQGNVLATCVSNNGPTGVANMEYSNSIHAAALNHSCFAVTVWNQYGSSEHKIYIFELKAGVLKKLKTLYLNRNHIDLAAESDLESKRQAQELPVEITELHRLERLTDEEFIIHGQDGEHMVLKCNFVTSTITKLCSLPFDLYREAAVRVMNPQLLLCVGPTRGNYYSQLYRIDGGKEAKEQKEASMELEETVLIRPENGAIDFNSIECLPDKVGFFFKVDVHFPSSIAPLVVPGGCFLHVFRKNSRENSIKLALPHLRMRNEVHSTCVTPSSVIYSNNVSKSGTAYLDKKGHTQDGHLNSFTHLHEIPLSRFVSKHRADHLKEMRARFHTYHALSKYALFSQQLCNIVVGYADEIPAWTKTLVPEQMYTLSPVNLFFAIINDTKYMSGGYANQLRALIAKPEENNDLLLQKLREVDTKGLTYLLFGSDVRSEQEKIVFQLLKQIQSFDDLTIATGFEQLQEDWCRHRQGVSCRMV